MTTRVDPRQYGDTPIFQELLEDRRGRWPGIPKDELSAAPAVPSEGPQEPVRPMYRVVPLPDIPNALNTLLGLPEDLRGAMEDMHEAFDPEATHPMPLPPTPEGD